MTMKGEQSQNSKKEDYKERQRKRREERRQEASLTIPEGWEPPAFTDKDNPHGRLFGKSEFTVKFPKYREKYLRENWAIVKVLLKQQFLSGDLDVIEGKMTVSTTPKTFDPYAIIKGLDLIRLLSRSVAVEQARRVLEDGVYCEVIPISHPNRECFIRRRNRLVGKDGTTLRALEVLSDCYVLVSGKTVSCIGPYAGVVQVKSVVDEAFKNNIHPYMSIKKFLLIKRLRSLDDMHGKDWSGLLPKTKNKALSRRKKPHKVNKKGEYTPFPPEQTPRKEDKEMAEGVYFLKEAERRRLKAERKAEKDKEAAAQRKRKRAAAFVAPPESAVAAKKSKVEGKEEQLAADLKRIKKLKKRK